MRYAHFVAAKIDQGKTNSQILKAVLKADQKGKIRIPFKKWQLLDRARLMLETSASRDRKIMQNGFDEESSHLFFNEPKWVKQFRHTLQTEDRSFTTLKKRPVWQTKVLTQIPQLDDWFGSGKRTHLQNLNVLDQHYQWSEAGFQHMIFVLRKALRKKCRPNAEMFRLWVNDLANMDGHLKAKTLSFDWLLCNDLLTPHQKHQARKLANLILTTKANKSTKIDQTITASQAKIVDQVLAWFLEDPLIRNRRQYLTKLSLVVYGKAEFNWKHFARGIEFACHHIKQPPDFELLKDYLDGEVDFEGKGKFQD